MKAPAADAARAGAVGRCAGGVWVVDPMKFQLLDADYVVVDEQAVLRLFGKTAAGETVCAFVDGFAPYFYVDDAKALSLLEGNPLVVRVEPVKRRLVHEHGKEQRLFKVVLRNPARTPEVREALARAGFKSYEADILFKYRYLADTGIGGCDWVEVEEAGAMRTSTVAVQHRIKALSAKPASAEREVPLRFLAFDIECVANTSGLAPEASRDPVVMISFAFSEPYRGAKALADAGQGAGAGTTLVLSTRAGAGVKHCGDEKALLQAFIDIVRDYDPDVLTGFNSNNFDVPYLLERMRKLGVRALFGRCLQKPVNSTKVGIRSRTGIVGRIALDSYEIIKKDFSLQRYGLDFVARKLLGEEKGDVRKSEIEKLWRGSAEEFARLARYAEQDSVLALKLVQKLHLLDKYLALARVSGVLLQDALAGGETTRIEHVLLREFDKEGFVFPLRPSEAEIDRREKRKRVSQEEGGLGGGYVIEPTKGAHANVIVLDFRSMYPSIIRAYNICPTTIIKGQMAAECSDCRRTPSGGCFLPRERRQGIIPRILEELVQRRTEAKKRQRAATDPALRRALDAEQWALKILANAFYGHLGYARAKIYDLDIANAITSVGRGLIQSTAERIRAQGFEVVYGDTDSVFVKVPAERLEAGNELAGLAAIGKQLAEQLNAQLEKPLELEFEKIFMRFIPLTKKRYAAWRFTDTGKEEKIETKGIETVRRDWCALTSEVMKRVLEILLKRDDQKEAVRYFRGIVDDLVKGRIELAQLLVTKTITKSPSSYDAAQPHVELVKKMRARNPAEAPGIGDRVGYVIVKGKGSLSSRAEDPEFIQEHGLQPDPAYYIENQLLPPVERIFSVLGVARSELLGNGRQTGLFEALRANGNGHITAGPKSIPLAAVNGYICGSCNTVFARPPLLGACTCGGGLKFSSQSGPAEIAVALSS